MIIGIGVDLVSIDRIVRLLSKFPERSKRRLFTEAEVSYCEGSQRPGESFAARFAAKEAVFKALGTGWADGTSWKEVEILRGDGAPYIRFSGHTEAVAAARGVLRAHVSLTHTETTAGAFVILEGELPGGDLTFNDRKSPPIC